MTSISWILFILFYVICDFDRFLPWGWKVCTSFQSGNILQWHRYLCDLFSIVLQKRLVCIFRFEITSLERKTLFWKDCKLTIQLRRLLWHLPWSSRYFFIAFFVSYCCATNSLHLWKPGNHYSLQRGGLDLRNCLHVTSFVLLLCLLLMIIMSQFIIYFPSKHTCQFSWIIWESPGYRMNLPVFRIKETLNLCTTIRKQMSCLQMYPNGGRFDGGRGLISFFLGVEGHFDTGCYKKKKNLQILDLQRSASLE